MFIIKKRNIFALVLAAVLICASGLFVSAAEDYAEYPIRNGDFSDGLEPWGIWSASGDAEPELIDGDAPEGIARSVKFSNGGGYVSFWSATMPIDQDDVILKTGDKVKVDTWVKVSGVLGGEYQFMITARNDDVNPGGFIKSDNIIDLAPNAWTKITLEDTIPDGGGDWTFIILSFEGDFEGTVQIAGTKVYRWGEVTEAAAETQNEEAPAAVDIPQENAPAEPAPAQTSATPAPRTSDNIFVVLGLLALISIAAMKSATAIKKRI